MKRRWIKTILVLGVIILAIIWWDSLDEPLFSDPTSTVIESRDGTLLGAHIAKDEQWRFPGLDSIPTKYKDCVITFEDQFFQAHPGVNPLSIFRAISQNIQEKRVVSGGSTITMQLIRLSRKGKPRNIQQKLIEILLAIRAELAYSKEEILNMYASNAPFGGNIVGLGAASWRYFGQHPGNLSWAESATLAVLPNAPSLIYPGKRNEVLLKKRNRLLKKLLQKNKIDSLTYDLSVLEPLPQQVYAIPQTAPHLLNRVMKEFPGQRIKTTLDAGLQKQINQLVLQKLKQLKANEIHNAAVLVMNVKKGEVLAYIGNSPNNNKNNHGEQVDIITSPRSSGSILKPFLYAAMQDQGLILPHTLIPDIPTQIGGFSPQNFNLKYEGAVPASRALSKSLNIPAVRMLKDYGVDQFHRLLKKLNFSTITKNSNHYGLSLILGGAEINLWELAGAYSSLGRLLISFEENDGLVSPKDFRLPIYNNQDPTQTKKTDIPISAGASWLTYEALLKVNRPEEEFGWDGFNSSQKIAWKTGTSFGFRDAWAVGINKNYLVAVWAGNADGEGRPGLTGTSSAAPVLFDVFNILPNGKWFTQPVEEMTQIPICSKSGYRTGRYCEDSDTIWILNKGLNTPSCPFHRIIHTDKSGEWQVHANEISVNNMEHKRWFVLPTVMEWYYKKKNPFYKPVPPMRNDCLEVEQEKVMDLIYPRENNQVFIPIQLDGTPGDVIFEAAHSIEASTIYWHLNDQYIGQTTDNHQIALNPTPGTHILTLYDNRGNELVKTINCKSKNNK